MYVRKKGNKKLTKNSIAYHLSVFEKLTVSLSLASAVVFPPPLL
jgi:hypothetical protein